MQLANDADAVRDAGTGTWSSTITLDSTKCNLSLPLKSTHQDGCRTPLLAIAGPVCCCLVQSLIF